MTKQCIFFLFCLFGFLHSQAQSIIGFEFGQEIDSVYKEIVSRYGTDCIHFIKGLDNPYSYRAKSDSTIIVDKVIYLYSNQQKTAKYTMFCFQKTPEGFLALSQITFVNELPLDWGDMLDGIYVSYHDYLYPQYIGDFEPFINDEGYKCFRFGKEKYSSGTWYGCYNVVKTSKNYRIYLHYTVPQI